MSESVLKRCGRCGVECKDKSYVVDTYEFPINLSAATPISVLCPDCLGELRKFLAGKDDRDD